GVGGRYPLAVVREDQVRNAVRVAAQLGHLDAGGHVPDPDLAVTAPAGDARPARTQGQRIDPVLVADQRAPLPPDALAPHAAPPRQQRTRPPPGAARRTPPRLPPPWGPGRAPAGRPSGPRHQRSWPSELAVTSVPLSGEKATPSTTPPWPTSRATPPRFEASQ